MGGRGAEALEELRIRYRQVGPDRYLVLANGPASAANVIDWRPEVDFVVALDELFKEAFGEKPRTGPTPIDARLTDLGRELFGALLPPPIRDCLEESIGIAQAEECKLRVRFDLPAELSDLPVEILCPPRGDPLGGPLALNGSLSVVRSVPGSRRNPRLPKPEDPPQPLSILVVVASPRDRPPLDVRAELDRLEDALRYFMGFDGVVLDFLGGPNSEDPATLAKLHDKVRMRGNPLAILLIAHGETSPDHGQACVVLESNDRSAEPIPADHVATTLSGSRRVRFVALNLCVGARVVGREPLSGVAQAIISNGVPAVVGMSTDVTDEAGSRFSAPLFQALSRNEAIDDAVQAARTQMAAIRADTRIEWCAPVLCVEDGCLRGQLFKVKSFSGEVDPMLEGQKAANRLKDTPAFADLAPAAFFCRATKDWQRVQDLATVGKSEANNQQERERFRRLEQEASVELPERITLIDKLCRALASHSPPKAPLTRPALRGLPQSVVKCLEREVARTNELRQLYEAAEAAEGTDDWETALRFWDAVLKISPNDQAAGKRREQARARLYDDGCAALAAGDWPEAVRLFDALLSPTAAKVEKDQNVERRAWAVAVEVFGLFGERDPLAGDRLAYATGRLAEIEGRWADARDAYEQVGDRLPDSDDAHLRRTYAEGRACEEGKDGEWSKAADAYATLPKGYADRDQRLPYARGRTAEQARKGAGDWPEVVAELAPLDDRYRDVALRRGYARARVNEDEKRWTVVLGVLAGLDDRFHGGDLGRLRTYATAREAEDANKWDRAAEFYGKLSDDERDVAERRPYAEARRAEKQAEKAAEEAPWAHAVRAYEVIPEHPHTDERLPYVKARLAEHQDDWPGVINALEGYQVAEDLRETANLLDRYSRGRVAEKKRQWPVAANAYQACGLFRDAPARVTYMKGRECEDGADWVQALAVYKSVADRLADADQRARRLKELAKALPWVDGLPRAGLVEDPSAPARRASPYQTLRAAGVTPSATAQEVKDASFVLMAHDLWTPEVRVAWDRLRTIVERLEDDARLYRLVDGPGLAREQGELDPGPPKELLAHLQDKLDHDAPLFLLLSGRREEAVAEWEQRLRHDLGDSGVAHALALSWVWQAVEVGDAGQHEQAAEAWERAIAYWGRVLSADAYWDAWRVERASCYDYAVFAADMSRARRALVEGLSERLAELADESQLDGRDDDAERYRRLAPALAVEFAAARALADSGGMLTSAESSTLACGPLFVRLHPALREPLAHVVARLDAEGADGVEPSARLRLRGLFSELGEAIVLLEQNRPDRALEALRGLHRVTLPELAADCGHELSGGVTPECPECGEFLKRNPGYGALSHRRTRLLRDAVDLATRALLALAQTALAEGRQGVATAFGRWREAIEVAENIGTQVRTKQAIVPVVLGRADVLKEEQWGQRQTGERLTEAIDLVAAVRHLVGKADEGQLAAKEVELLTARGLWYGSSCYEYEEPSGERATADLRRALELNPEALDTREHLSYALVSWACSLHHKSSAGLRLRLLVEALSTVHVGLDQTPGYALFHTALVEALNEFEQWCFDELSDEELERRLRDTAPLATADAADQELDATPVAGLLALVGAVRSDPGRSEIRRRLVGAITRVSDREERREGC